MSYTLLSHLHSNSYSFRLDLFSGGSIHRNSVFIFIYTTIEWYANNKTVYTSCVDCFFFYHGNAFYHYIIQLSRLIFSFTPHAHTHTQFIPILWSNSNNSNKRKINYHKNARHNEWTQSFNTQHRTAQHKHVNSK